MRAARIHAFGSAPVLDAVDDPRPAEGESLVEVIAAVVGHLDLGIATGNFPILPQLPHIPGVSGAGRVIESANHRRGAIVEIAGSQLGISRDGTWGEFAAVPDAALARVPSDVDLLQFLAFSGSFTTAHLAVSEIGKLEPGEQVIVTGAAGCVGSLAVQLALARGASAVVGAVGREGRRRDVPSGARAVLDRAEAAACLNGCADLLIDTVGGRHLSMFLELVRPGGRACLVGYTAGTALEIDLPRLLVADVRLLPVNSMTWREHMGPALRTAAIAELRKERFQIRVETYELSDAPAALEQLRGGRARGRVILVPDA